MKVGKKNRSSNSARRVHQVYPGTGRFLEQAVQGHLHLKGMIGQVPWEFTKKQLLKFEIIPEKYHFGVNSWFLSRATHRGNKKNSLELHVEPSRGRHDSLPQGRQPCGSARLLLLSQLQVLSKQGTNPFECTVLILREHIRHYIFWIRIMKRTETLKLGELCSLYFTLSIAVVLTRRLWNWGQALERVFVFYN